MKILQALLCMMSFFISFGVWQNKIFFGMSIAKIIIPIMIILLLGSNIRRVRLPFQAIFLIFIYSLIPSIINSHISFIIIIFHFLGYLVLCNIINTLIKTQEQLINVCRWYLFGLIVITFSIFISIFTDYDIGKLYFGNPTVINIFGLKRVLGTELNPNAAALYYIAGIPIATYLTMVKKSITWRFIFIIFICLSTIVLLMTASRAAILGVIVSIVILTSYRVRSLKRYYLLGLIVIPLFYYISISAPEILIKYIQVAEVHDGGDPMLLVKDKNVASQIRLDVLHTSLLLIKEHPFVGGGFGSTQKRVQSLTGHHVGTHNIFLKFAIESGLLTAIVFIIFIFLILNTIRNSIKNETDEERSLSFTLIYSIIVGLLVFGLFHDNSINILLWLFIALGYSTISIHRTNVIHLHQENNLQYIS